jgi:hypothetical protein
MHSAPRTVRAKGSCHGKIRFDDRAAAQRGAQRVIDAGKADTSLHPYFCGNCGKWHIGRGKIDPNKDRY